MCDANRSTTADNDESSPTENVVDLRVYKIGKVLKSLTPPELQNVISEIEKQIPETDAE